MCEKINIKDNFGFYILIDMFEKVYYIGRKGEKVMDEI
jgi:hypothetical protein